jgi:hypothetical protein
MITITISGYGAEVTHGKLPATVIDEIYENLGTTTPSREELAEYLTECEFKGTHFSWYDIDDVYHSYGPYLNEAMITVRLNDTVVYNRECIALNIDETETAEIDPFAGNLLLDAYGVLTCEDVVKGQLQKYVLSTEKDFDVKQLKLQVSTLGDYSIITGIKYKNKLYNSEDDGDADSQGFYVNLHE